MAGISEDVENLRVNWGDFKHALDEVKPAFGVSEEELQAVIQNGIIHYNQNIEVWDLTETATASSLIHCPSDIVHTSRWGAIC